MAKHDEWCEFCEDKMKNAEVVSGGKSYGVCLDCKLLTPRNE